jgi:hypothetical protein
MEKTTKIYPELTGLELIHRLEGTCDGVSNETFSLALSQEEENSMKDRIVDLSVQRQIIEEKKEEILRGFKKELKPINEELHETLKTVKRGTNLRTGKLYKFVEGHTTSLYDENGSFIYSRPMREDERQFSIKDSPGKAQNE